MKQVTLLSNGDFRDAVGKVCWPKQEETLQHVEKAFASLGIETVRANPYKEEKGHGFMTTQAEVCTVFSRIPGNAPIVLVLSSWVWAHHVASCLKVHEGPILLVGNFDGTWPGLVSLLNHSASFERMGITYSRTWTGSFSDDPAFMDGLSRWISSGSIQYPMKHCTRLEALAIPAEAKRFGEELAHEILKEKRILGQFDPGCMGMINAVMSPDRLAQVGFPLEYLSQSDLLAEMSLVTEGEALGVLAWLHHRKVSFEWGKDDGGLTERQVLEQMKMYIAAGRMFSRYGLSAIGIPYQYGLVRSTMASDLPEGMLNNADRPEIHERENGQAVKPGEPVIHFNEGDTGSGVPQVLMHDILKRKGMPTETTLHDVRWGDTWKGRFVWSLEISGGAPPAHFGGWDKVTVFRQPAMYFPKGGGTCTGVCRPGAVTWARFYESYNEIGLDVGLGEVVDLPAPELDRRREATNREWPIANVHFPGYGRDELMSSHRSNHVTICYGDIVRELGATASSLGIPVRVVGDARSRFS